MSHTVKAAVYIYSVIPRLEEALRKMLPAAVQLVCLKGSSGSGCEVTEEEMKALQDAEILLADSSFLCMASEKLPKLKWAQLTWAGVEHLVHYFSDKPKPHFPVTRLATESFSQLMAEYVIGQIISHERNWNKVRENQLKSEWDWNDATVRYQSLQELTVAVLGLGEIGKEVCRCLKAFRCCVHGLSRTLRTSDVAHVDRHWTPKNLDDMLVECDYIVNVLPSTPASCGLLSRDKLKMAKKCPVLLNIGRGTLLSEEDIIKALDAGWISGAILDVFLNEPLDKNSRLWLHPKVVITPHTAAVSLPRYVAVSFCENYQLFLSGLPLCHEVNWERGY